MSLVYVTGAPTSGKTAISEELAVRGFEVHDTDDPNHTGIAGWHLRETDEYVAGFNQLPMTPTRFDTHAWRLTDGTIERFKAKSTEHSIYFCGSLREPELIIAAANYLVFLTTDEETIRHRFTLPREVEWGKEQWQIEKTVERNIELEEEYRGYGAIMINAVQPLSEVVDNLVMATT